MHEQCEDRTYRIGQLKPVFVKYLVASSALLDRPTLDEAVIDLGERKRGDAKALLGGKKDSRGQQRMNSLFAALSKGAQSASTRAGAGASSAAAEKERRAQRADPGSPPLRQARPRPSQLPPSPAAPKVEAAEPSPKRARGPR